MHDLAAVHAWLALREGAFVRGAWSYLWAVFRGLGRTRHTAGPILRGWIKEPAHQLLRAAGNLPDRPQF